MFFKDFKEELFKFAAIPSYEWRRVCPTLCGGSNSWRNNHAALFPFVQSIIMNSAYKSISTYFPITMNFWNGFKQIKLFTITDPQFLNRN